MNRLPMVAAFILLLAGTASAEDLYISQSGGGTGSSCSSTLAASFFNNSSNWGTGAAKISPGDTVHLCGTLTTAITFQTSGTSGSPIIVLFEPNAKFSAPTWSGAVISASSKSYIELDGGTNGLLEATNNGSRPTYANQNEMNGVSFMNCSNCRIHNLTIQNLFVKNTADSQGTSSGIYMLGSRNSRIDHNVIHDAKNCIDWYLGGSTGGIEVDNNTLYRCNWGTSFGMNGAVTINSVKFHNNELYDWNNWDDLVANDHHHNGIFMFLEGGPSTVTGLEIYNNYFHGDPGTLMTANIYLEANHGNIVSPRIFNNIHWMSGHKPTNGHINSKGSVLTPSYLNNVYGYAPGNTGMCLMFQGATGATVKNNIFLRCDMVYFLSTGTVGTVVTASDYNNYYQNIAFGPSSGNNTTLAAWQSYSRLDVASTNADPILDSNFRPRSGSSAIGRATNLTNLGIALLNLDKAGVARPSGSTPWDTGAYANSQVTGGAPNPPTNLTVTVR